jgi:hypothetical protein
MLQESHFWELVYSLPDILLKQSERLTCEIAAMDGLILRFTASLLEPPPSSSR